MLVRSKRVQKITCPLLRTLQNGVVIDQRRCQRVEPPRPRPGVRIVENPIGIDCRHRFHERPPRMFARFTLAPRLRHPVH